MYKMRKTSVELVTFLKQPLWYLIFIKTSKTTAKSVKIILETNV